MTVSETREALCKDRHRQSRCDRLCAASRGGSYLGGFAAVQSLPYVLLGPDPIYPGLLWRIDSGNRCWDFNILLVLLILH